MSYDPNECAKRLNEKGFVPSCDPVGGGMANHCEGFMTTPLYHADCASKDLYTPVQFICCQNGTTKEIRCFPLDQVIADCTALGSPWNLISCYCCCACFAWDTLVATPTGGQQIYLLGKNDLVLSGSVKLSSGTVQLTWEPSIVTFSDGTGEYGEQAVMVYLEYGNPDAVFDLVCSPDQPFLLPSGKFAQAMNLRPGDQLMDGSGNPVTIRTYGMGPYRGGVHHITAGDPNKSDMYEHLLLTGGTLVDGQLMGSVVAGDFDVQSSFGSLSADMVSAEHQSRPQVGTQEFLDSLGDNFTSRPTTVLFAQDGRSDDQIGDGPRLIREGRFNAFQLATPTPSGAQSLFTEAQAMDLLKNGSQVPISNPLPQQLFDTIKLQLAGFFPEINFYYDPLNLLPNLYAYNYYGQKCVLMSGGLARMMGFNYEGLMMAMSWGAACFYGGPPQDALGFTGVAAADYYSFGVHSRRFWVGSGWMTYVQSAMQQFFAMFNLIDPAHKGGNPLDPLLDPSIDCRINSINEGFVGGSLPECAGGPTRPKVELLDAEATELTGVQLNFSIALTDSALNPKNYTLTPAATITNVKFGSKAFIVMLETELSASTSYSVQAANLTSYIGTGMDPDHSSADFTTP